MAKLPRDVGSRDLIAVLLRLGFKRGPIKKGSHQSYNRPNLDKTHTVVTVVEGKKSIPVGTLDAILKRAGISREEFLKELDD